MKVKRILSMFGTNYWKFENNRGMIFVLQPTTSKKDDWMIHTPPRSTYKMVTNVHCKSFKEGKEYLIKRFND